MRIRTLVLSLLTLTLSLTSIQSIASADIGGTRPLPINEDALKILNDTETSLKKDLESVTIEDLSKIVDQGHTYCVRKMVWDTLFSKLSKEDTRKLIAELETGGKQVRNVRVRILSGRLDCDVEDIFRIMETADPETQELVWVNILPRINHLSTKTLLRYVDKYPWIDDKSQLVNILIDREDCSTEDLVRRIGNGNYVYPGWNKKFSIRFSKMESDDLLQILSQTQNKWPKYLICLEIANRDNVSNELALSMMKTFPTSTELLEKLSRRKNLSINEKIDVMNRASNLCRR